MQNPQSPEEVHTTRPCSSLNVEAALAEAEALTAANGQRLTAIRRKVLELLLRSPAPAKAYDLLGRLDGEGAAKPPTIYRALNFLQDAGLAHKIESLNAYVACGHARHSHSAIFLICESCGSAEELRGAVTYDAIKEETEAAGFRTEHTVVEARGTCRACQG